MRLPWIPRPSPQVFADMERDAFTFAENRLSIYGKSRQEWSKLANWFDVHGMYHPHNRWMIQIPRTYTYLVNTKAISSFEDLLGNIFGPLWEVLRWWGRVVQLWTPHPQGCIGREEASVAAPQAVRQAVGGGCQSGWGRLLSVTNAVEAGTCRQGHSGWAQAGCPGRGGVTPLQCIPPPPPQTNRVGWAWTGGSTTGFCFSEYPSRRRCDPDGPAIPLPYQVLHTWSCGGCDVLWQASPVSRPADLVLWSSGSD